MSGSNNTTVSVDRHSTKRELDRRLLDLKHRSGDGERVSMDDVIRDLLAKAEAFERLDGEEQPDLSGEAIGA